MFGWIAFALSFAPAATLPVVEAEPLRFSITIHDITPEEPLPLGGYTERQDRVMDGVAMPQQMRVLRLEQGDRQVLVASLDFLTIPESFVAEVQAQIDPDVTLVLAATHTHSAPDSQMLNARMTMRIPGIAGYRQRVTEAYVSRVVEGLALALAEETSTAEDLFLQKFSTNLVRSRRPSTDVDDQGRILWSSDQPLFAHASAHATLLDSGSNELHGDWPGALSVQLRSPVFVGAVGNASPSASGETGVEKVSAFVEKWLSFSRENRREGRDLQLLPPNLSVGVAKVELPQPRPSADFEQQFGAPGPLGELLVNRFAPLEASITLIAIGELALVAVPAELTHPAGQLIIQAVEGEGFTEVVLIGLANGWMGYVMDEEDFMRGGYEVALSFYGPGVIQNLVDAAAGAAREARR